MEYEWYADIFFLEEVFRDFLMLCLAAVFLQKKLCPGRLILGAFAGGFWGVFAVIGPAFPLPVLLFLTVFFTGSLMAVLAFQVRGIKGILKADAAFFASSAVISGGVQLLGQYFFLSSLESLAVFGFFSLGAAAFFKRLTEKKAIGQNRYRVILYYQGRKKEFLGLADSGNRLLEPVTGKPVSVISYKEAKDFCERMAGILYIPYRAVGTAEGMLPGILMEKMEIVHENGILTVEKPVVAVSKEPLSVGGDFTMLLPESLIFSCGRGRREQ